MSTLLEILDKTTQFFEKHQIPDARLDAQYILAHCLGLTRMQLYLNFDRPLTPQDLDAMRPMVARRSKREPLQHILGDTSFRGHRIFCDKRALIPRPETEELVELGLNFLKGKTCPQVLDVGTGTGAIPIALALECPEAKLTAVDLSADALALAESNVRAHQLQDRIQLLPSDLLGSIPPQQFDLVISNPPYIPTGVLTSLQVEVRDYDPAMALDGGADGLQLVRRFLQGLPSFLHFDSLVLMELGEKQVVALQNEHASGGWTHWQPFEGAKDIQGVERFLIAKLAR